jgi:virginiamycin B lyase
MLGFVVALGLLSPGEGMARATAPGVLRLPNRSISVSAPKFSASAAPGRGRAVLDVTLDSVGPRSVAVARSDFKLSADGDLFGAQKWSAGRSRVKVAPGHSRGFHLTFGAARAAVKHGAIFYRPADGGVSGVLPLNGSRAFAHRPTAHRSTQQAIINTFLITQGVGDPWGTAIDGSGNIWFAEPGCDFAPTCAADTPPGQIGKLDPSSGAFTYYTLPSIPGNQPIFVALDSSGNLWFTTPNNSMIGELSPSTGLIAQWPVTAGSGPWDLTFADGQIWYTEHLVSAVGRFNPTSHTHQDFQTPSADSNPYGITASGGRIWFTENNSNVDRVALLDTTQGNAISEYPIVQPPSGTPHLIVVGANGQPWWTEGWSNTIATLNAAAATPGSCGPPSGTCNGVQRFQLPSSGTCGGQTHTSGIAFEAAADRLWLDNSLTAQVGSFTPSTGTFAMNTLSDCSAHPHDGLNLDSAGDVWFDEEFANAIGELAGPPPPTNTSPPTVSGSTLAGQTTLPPANTAAPTIGGIPRQARTLTARKGSWTNEPTHFSYRWQRCDPRCANIADATSDSYRVAARDIDAKVRVIVTASNDGGSAQAKSRGRGPVGPSLKRVKAALSQLLAATTKGRTITTLRKKGGYRFFFRAPSGGSLKISWHARSALVATARRRFSKARAANVTIHLTRVGKRLLRRANRVTVAAKLVYIPVGEAAVSSQKRFTLSAP